MIPTVAICVRLLYVRTAVVKCVAETLFRAVAADNKRSVITIKTNKIAGGGVMSALCIVFLFCAKYVPNLTLAFLFAASITVGICILRYKTACALISYVAVSAITIFIIPDISLLFIVLFGIYPVIKLYIEKIRNITVEYVIKFVFANIFLTALYIVLKAVDEVHFWDFGLPLLWIAGVLALLFYDLMFTVVINAFHKSYYKYLK